jgi:hypothetical protein
MTDRKLQLKSVRLRRDFNPLEFEGIRIGNPCYAAQLKP